MNRQIASSEQFFANAEAMFAALEELVAMRLAGGIAARGAASLVASGGTTPAPLYRQLARLDMDWRRVSVTLSDERWVEPDDGRSNEKLIRMTLLQGYAAQSRLVPLKTSAPRPRMAEEDVNAAIAAMPHPFDVTLLGMGTDGHIASLFPHAERLETALDAKEPMLVRGIVPRNPELGERMSLTLRALLDSRLVAIVVRGEEKMRGYREAMAGSDVLSMPVRAILKQPETPVRIFWAP